MTFLNIRSYTSRLRLSCRFSGFPTLHRRLSFSKHLSVRQSIDLESSTTSSKARWSTHEAPRSWNNHTEDIIPDDLDATLEAHRASNRGNIFRKIDNTVARKVKNLVVRKVRSANGRWPLDALPKTDNGEPTDPIKPITPTLELDRKESNEGVSGSDIPVLKWTQSPDIDKRPIYDVKERLATYESLKNRLSKEAQKSRNVRPWAGRFIATLGYRDVSPFRPWLQKAPNKVPGVHDAYDRLDDDIISVRQFICLSERDKRMKERLAQDLIQLLRSATDSNDLEFELRGSLATGLAAVESDIDIGFWLPALHKQHDERGPNFSYNNPNNRKAIQGKLHHIRDILQRTKLFHGFTTVDATHQLLHFQHKGSLSNIQIVCGLPETHRIEMVKSYLQEYPNLRTVYAFIRAALQARGLQQPEAGGLGSYPLFCMILASFKLGEAPSKSTPTHALLHFLRYYSSFRFTEQGISIDPPTLFKIRRSKLIGTREAKEELKNDSVLWWRNHLSTTNPARRPRLVLIDPADESNDVCRRAFRMLDVQAMLRTFGLVLKEHFDDVSADRMHPFDMFFGTTLGAVRDGSIGWNKWSQTVMRNDSWTLDPDSLPHGLLSVTDSLTRRYKDKTLVADKAAEQDAEHNAAAN